MVMVEMVSVLGVFFFFSSRRRHTRSLRDWSSDVCSSDLRATARRLDRELIMDTVLQDIRYALRTFANRPGFTSLAILTLALGIGPTTAVYSFVEGVLLRPLPYKDAGRLVRIGWTWKQYYVSRRMAASPSLAEVRVWMAQSHSFAEMSPYWGDGPVLTGLGEATRVTAYTVSSNLFPLL